ncbi:lysine-rich arabinogalactan protein 19-like, partial [Temnothorax curvispinosus]|uniref:Lysine-rich arabinogalactan protein 19-like n=1 Tax=Temnothorax curvispinosus TaxID=300111 RepID=A0A6J1QB71_9HYME
MATDRSESTIKSDILADIEKLLAEPMKYDPVCPGFGTTWTKLFAPSSAATATAITESVRPAVAPPTPKNVPTVGCTVQRSDIQQRRKLEWLTTPPPPLNRTKPRHARNALPKITNIEKTNIDLSTVLGRPTTVPPAPTPTNNPLAATSPPPPPITGSALPEPATAKIPAPPSPQPAPADVRPVPRIIMESSYLITEFGMNK